jgi:hypothetical protein
MATPEATVRPADRFMSAKAATTTVYWSFATLSRSCSEKRHGDQRLPDRDEGRTTGAFKELMFTQR